MMRLATLSAPPITPDPDEARRLLEEELSKPVYTVTEPTLFDRVSRAVWDFFNNLLSASAPAGFDGLLAVVVIVAVVLLLVAAFLIWGRPRITQRSRTSGDDLFTADERSAAELRREAESLAARGEWDAAIVVRFRAIARAVAERGIVDPVPGATVHAFARETARAFPAEADRLELAATAFDDVRYLRRPGTAELYAVVAETDGVLAAARPVLHDDLFAEAAAR